MTADFKPEPQLDIYRDYYVAIEPSDTTSLSINFSAWRSPAVDRETDFDETQGDVDLGWLDVTKEQARHILAYLSETTE